MKNAQPLFDSSTHQRIEVRDRVDLDWLQSFDSLAEVAVEAARQMEDVTVLAVHTDQQGSLSWCTGWMKWE